MNKSYSFIINNSEITAGTRGASAGPTAIFTAARSAGSQYFGQFETQVLTDSNAALDHPTPFPFAKYIDAYAKVFYGVKEAVAARLNDDKFPIVLAGDHGSAAGTISGIKGAMADKRLGVVWIDAHADIHSPFTTPSGNMHGMPLAIVTNQDNLKYKRNDVDAKTREFWEAFQASASVTPMVQTSDLVYVGVRDCEEEEIAVMDEFSITNHTVELVRQLGVPTIVERILTQLADCDAIYISFDVDSMDPELTSYGTGTPVGNGLSPQEAKDLLTLLMENEKTVCLEIVEVNPCLDNKKNKMAEITFDILSSIVTK